MEPSTLTISPAAAAAARTERTRAVIACHLNGVCADVPALQQELPGLPIVEDCAQAHGSTMDGVRAGCLGELAVFSFGPGKSLCAGEGGMLITADAELHETCLGLAAHPVRQRIGGVATPDPTEFSIRPHPMTAVLGLYELERQEALGCGLDQRQSRAALRRMPGVRLLGDDARRTSQQPLVPLLAPAGVDFVEPVSWIRSGSCVLPVGGAEKGAQSELLERVRLAPVPGLASRV